MRGLLTSERYDEIKEEITFMYEECGIDTFPIDCFMIARMLHYKLRPYSKLSNEERMKAYLTDVEGYSYVEQDPATRLFHYVICYNDHAPLGRMRFTILHEIGHVYLGHHDHPEDFDHEIEEAEADFFAKYAIAPPPLINCSHCNGAEDVARLFQTSAEASQYIFDYYEKWLEFGPRGYQPFELQMLRLFHAA